MIGQNLGEERLVLGLHQGIDGAGRQLAEGEDAGDRLAALDAPQDHREHDRDDEQEQQLQLRRTALQ